MKKNKNLNDSLDELIEDLPSDEEIIQDTITHKKRENGKRAHLSGQLLKAATNGGYAVIDKLNDTNRKNGHFEKLRKNKIGKPRDEETKKKLKEASKHSWRIILQYTKDGKFVREWPNFTSIKDELGFNYTNICACCQNKPKYKSAYGFIWKYKN